MASLRSQAATSRIDSGVRNYLASPTQDGKHVGHPPLIAVMSIALFMGPASKGSAGAAAKGHRNHSRHLYAKHRVGPRPHHHGITLSSVT